MKALNAAFLTAALCGLVDYLCTRMLIEKVARLLGRLLAYL
jgi:hypothetical protein